MKRRIKIFSADAEVKPSDKSDIPLIVVTFVLVAFGVLMVYSAGSYTGKRLYGSEFYFVYKQLVGVVLGEIGRASCRERV